MPNDAVVAKCYGIWKNKDKHKHLFTLDFYGDDAVQWYEKSFTLSKADKDGSFPAVCLIGDRFYKGNFLPAIEIQKSFHTMNGAYHDLNHWSTSYPGGFMAEPNIEYIVGYQDGTEYDMESKAMKTNIHIVDSAPKAAVWKGFMEICRLAKRIPNVSVTFWADRKTMSVKDLPEGVDYKRYGLSEDDTFTALVDLEFHALATVFQGACDDKSGCGIGIECDVNDMNTVKVTYFDTPDTFYTVELANHDEIEQLQKDILKQKIKMEELTNE